MNCLEKTIEDIDRTINLLQSLDINDRKTRQETMDEQALQAIVNGAVTQATERTRSEFRNIVDQLNARIDALQPPSAAEEYKDIEIIEGVECDEPLDIVKSLPEFKGEGFRYISWRQAAVTAHKLFERYQGSSKYYQAVAIIRNKVVGRADSVLSSYNIVLNFYAILNGLDFAYSDKTSIYTLEQELSTLRQGQRPIIKFYSDIESRLTSIINKVIMSYEGDSTLIQSLNQKYRMDALRVFISGLNKPLCDTLFACRPVDLPTALAMAQELETNQNRYRFATIYNNGLGSVQQGYFQQTNPGFHNLNASVRNIQPSSYYQRPPIRNLLSHSQVQQQQYVQPQQLYPTPTPFYPKPPVGNLSFSNQMRQPFIQPRQFHSKSQSNSRVDCRPPNVQSHSLPHSQALDSDVSMRTLRSTARPTFQNRQIVNHLGHEEQPEHSWEEESNLINFQENQTEQDISFEDEIHFLGVTQSFPTSKEK